MDIEILNAIARKGIHSGFKIQSSKYLNLMTMDVMIKAIHFDISDKLEAFTNKKIDKLVRRFDVVSGVNVNYRLVKPETANNKEAGVELQVPGSNPLFASKTADTFEEALDLALQALEPQLERNKDKK